MGEVDLVSQRRFAPTSQGLLRPLSKWLGCPNVSEILINKPHEIYVEKEGQLAAFEVKEYDEQTLSMLFQLIANENQQELSAKCPLLSGSLLDGTRVQLVLPPTAKHHTLSIRRNVVRGLGLEDYKQSDFYKGALPFDISQCQYESLPGTEKRLAGLYAAKDWDAFVRLAIELKKNIVISGGTSSGKTTFLNACLRHMPLSERIITLEDTREIDVPHPNQVNLLASKGGQGEADVSMQDLVQCCLRLRPDRIIMGEIRGKEIMDFVAASATGHARSHSCSPGVVGGGAP